MEEPALRELLAALAAGDEDALAAVYDATINQVYGLALRITGKPEEAEEAVSDTYLQVWRQAPRYEAQRGSVRGWMLTLCRSRALDILRRREPALDGPEAQAACDALVDHDADPQDLLLATEHDSVIRTALLALSVLQRQALALAFFRGFTHQEIALHLGLPLGTVKSHIRRALKLMQEHLETGNRTDVTGV